MTTSPSSTRSPGTSLGLPRPQSRAWVAVLAAFVLGLMVGLRRPSLPETAAIVVVGAALAVALLGSSRFRRPSPSRLSPLGLSPVFSVKLSGTVLTMGRSELCDVTLPLETVSSHHCRVYRKRSAWFVEDLGSRNGTRVNGKPVRKKRLEVGDTLSIADFEFRVC